MSRPEFHAILQQLGELHDKKSADCGVDQDPFANLRMCKMAGIEPWEGVVIRMGDKYSRLCTAMRGTLRNEGVEDAFLDMAVYSILGLILYKDSCKEGESDIGICG